MATEPSVAVDGTTAFVVAPGQPGNDTPFWRVDLVSLEAEYLGDIPTGVGDQDDDIEVDDDGALWVTTLWTHEPGSTRGAGFCSSVSRSTDGGATWETDPNGCGRPLPFQDRPWLARGGGKGLLIARQQLPNVAVGLRVSVSEGDGPWEERDTILNDAHYTKPAWDGQRWVIAMFPFVGSDGGPFVLPGDTVRTAGPVLFSSADGQEWQEKPVGEEPADMRFPSLDIDGPQGVVTWIVAREANQVRAVFMDGGEWSEPSSLEEGGSNWGSWAAVEGPHRIVAWLHTAEEAHACAVSADSEWRVHVWLDGVVREVPTVVHRGPLFGEFLDQTCPEGSRRLGDFMTADVAADGRGVVALTDGIQDNDGTHGPVRLFVIEPALDTTDVPADESSA